MRSKQLRLAMVGAVTLPVLIACAAPRAKQPTQHYVPVTRAMEPWGGLELDDRHLRFDAFEGELQLQYAGRMPEIEGSDLSSASVYRLTNADEYTRQNRDYIQLCSAPPRWLAVSSRSGAPAWSGEIWVALLTVNDWSQYTPGGPGYCAGGRYVRATTD